MRSVGRVGRWSIRHPWLAIVAWLAFVVLAVAALAATGTESLNNGSVGESARGYSLMDEHRAWPPAREYGYLHSDTLVASDDAFQGAALGVAAVLRAKVGSEATFRRSRDRHSVLVAADVRQPFSTRDLRSAVLAGGK